MYTERHNKNLGDRAEAITLQIYEKQGWVKMKNNFRTRNSEIDLILYKEESMDELLFVEVKCLEVGTGYNELGLKPEDNFTKQKQRHFKRGIESYISANKLHNHNIRIDLCCITHNSDLIGESGEWRIKRYENIILD